jgi:hypothetical protein
MSNINLRQEIEENLSQISPDNLKVIAEFVEFIKQKQGTIKTNMSATIKNDEDPLAELRNSDFIGCFSGEPDLGEKSEEIAKAILAEKNN